MAMYIIVQLYSTPLGPRKMGWNQFDYGFIFSSRGLNSISAISLPQRLCESYARGAYQMYISYTYHTDTFKLYRMNSQPRTNNFNLACSIRLELPMIIVLYWLGCDVYRFTIRPDKFYKRIYSISLKSCKVQSWNVRIGFFICHNTYLDSYLEQPKFYKKTRRWILSSSRFLAG